VVAFPRFLSGYFLLGLDEVAVTELACVFLEERFSVTVHSLHAGAFERDASPGPAGGWNH
jgi:hypothetical protein